MNSDDHQSPEDCYEEALELLDIERSIKRVPAYAEYDSKCVASKKALKAKIWLLNREYDAKIAILEAKYMEVKCSEIQEK